MNSQIRTKLIGMIVMKKLINQSGAFEDVVKFNQPMELFEKRRGPCVSCF